MCGLGEGIIKVRRFLWITGLNMIYLINYKGQVGNGNRQDHPFPVQIKIYEDDEPVSLIMVGTGASHSVALSDDGNVR